MPYAGKSALCQVQFLQRRLTVATHYRAEPTSSSRVIDYEASLSIPEYSHLRVSRHSSTNMFGEMQGSKQRYSFCKAFRCHQ